MQILQDRAYFVSRAAKARTLAIAAADPGIRQIHLYRAKRYDELATSERCTHTPYAQVPDQ